MAHDLTDLLSPQTSQRRRYSEADVDLLRRVRQMTTDGMNLHSIRAALPVVEPPALPYQLVAVKE